MKLCSLKKICKNCYYWKQLPVDKNISKIIGNCYYNPAQLVYYKENVESILLIPKRPVELNDSFCCKFKWNSILKKENMKSNIIKMLLFWRK